MDQLDQYLERLPYKPYCSDDKTARLIRTRRHALQHTYISVNPPSLKFWLAFDIDNKKGLVAEDLATNDIVMSDWAGSVAWERANLGMPNVCIGNPKNGNAHLLYGLDAPVATSDAARLAPMKYLAAIERAYLAAMEPFGADAGYSGLMVKNPTHSAWRTFWGRIALWSLDELADYVNLDRHRPKYASNRKMECTGVGRNVTLFNRLGPEGKWSYEAVRKYRGKSFSEWLHAVLDKAQEMNGEFPGRPGPLPDSEVRGIAKSVAKWVWSHDEDAETKFVLRQQRKGLKGGTASGIARRVGSVTEAAPWQLDGISRATWYRRKSGLIVPASK
jgi:hypothetical protein